MEIVLYNVKYVDNYVLTIHLINGGTFTVPKIATENMSKNNLMP